MTERGCPCRQRRSHSIPDPDWIRTIIAYFSNHLDDFLRQPLFGQLRLSTVCCWHRRNQNAFNFVPLVWICNYKRGEKIPKVVIAGLRFHRVGPQASPQSIGLTDIIGNVIPIQNVDARLIEEIDTLCKRCTLPRSVRIQMIEHFARPHPCIRTHCFRNLSHGGGFYQNHYSCAHSLRRWDLIEIVRNERQSARSALRLSANTKPGTLQWRANCNHWRSCRASTRSTKCAKKDNYGFT
jgi:hypothetical protein